MTLYTSNSVLSGSGPDRWWRSPWHGDVVVPRFMDCEGEHWDSAWSRFRTLLQKEPPAATLRAGRAPSAYALSMAEALIESAGGYEDLYRSSSLVTRRVMRDLGFSPGQPVQTYDPATADSDGFVADSMLRGFCLYGMMAATFVKALSYVVDLAVAPDRGKVEQAIYWANFGLKLLGPYLGLDFVGSSSWPLHTADIRLFVEGLDKLLVALADGNTHKIADIMQASPWRKSLEQVPVDQLLPEMNLHLAVVMANPAHPSVRLLDDGERVASTGLAAVLHNHFSRKAAGSWTFSIVGLGDHATGTLDAALMMKRAILQASPETTVTMSLHGLSCPAEAAGRHHCRLRCHVLGTQCGPTTDALAEWVHKFVLGNEAGDASTTSADASRPSLRAALQTLSAAFDGADLFVCAHPAAMCFIAFEQLFAMGIHVPMFVHISSTLLYGAPGCSVCSGQLRQYDTDEARGYLDFVRDLLMAPLPIVALTEGAVLSAQVQLQLGVALPAIPPLALYLDHRVSYLTDPDNDGTVDKVATVLVTRARFFTHPIGLFLKTLLTEIAIANEPVAPERYGHFWFAEALGESDSRDQGSDKPDAWKGWDEMARCQAAFFIPSDLHQRTFIELYRMSIPIFMPDAEWLIRLPLVAPFGTFAYHGVASGRDADALPGAADVPTFFSAEDATVRAVYHWYSYSDYAHFPHIEKCKSIPDLLLRLASADYAAIATSMKTHYDLVSRGAMVAFSQTLSALLTTLI
eukprot:TRINITY_DN16297_c0_g1_i1.p1 TRINITY_DN16297_c0_g1~~TRINITY_DN16297_c0_g1_i1.p1  ORF type:complete len:746 (-),score=104.65 TRINITY_DN16297_c0_g1_i1:37-2274(-)